MSADPERRKLASVGLRRTRAVTTTRTRRTRYTSRRTPRCQSARAVRFAPFRPWRSSGALIAADTGGKLANSSLILGASSAPGGDAGLPNRRWQLLEESDTARAAYMDHPYKRFAEGQSAV